jgi:hypothetical protein
MSLASQPPFFAPNLVGRFMEHPLTRGCVLVIGVAQNIHYLQRPVGDLPQALEYVFIANWFALFIYGLSYIVFLGVKGAMWATSGIRNTLLPHPTDAYDWKFFLFSPSLIALLLSASLFWSAAQVEHDRPINDGDIAACARNLNDTGLRYLAKNLQPTMVAGDFKGLCLAAFHENRTAVVKPPETIPELLRRFRAP